MFTARSAQPDVDGFLVGGASLKPEVADIVKAISEAKGSAAMAPSFSDKVGVAINGFGRIGRQVARIAMKDPEVELKLINASYDSEYLTCQLQYGSFHDDGTIQADATSS